MKITISIASKAPIKPLKRAWVDLGQNLGGNRHTDEGKVGVKWGWKSTPKGLDESWIKLGWNRGKAGVKSGRISPDKRRTRSVQNASVWRRGRIGYFSDFSARKALKTRRIEPVQDRYKKPSFDWLEDDDDDDDLGLFDYHEPADHERHRSRYEDPAVGVGEEEDFFGDTEEEDEEMTVETLPFDPPMPQSIPPATERPLGDWQEEPLDEEPLFFEEPIE
ncbi:MAG: hypothetical protein UW10_C0018G0034 [Candidatus Magasanikbacteria bacterium GW2011_GWA2_43_9]|nr:MAG: hypothetical protein UW10_C0018G0034 [Candidatus Magasanikbacteria bacterium GW2011_GWA2_43_9]